MPNFADDPQVNPVLVEILRGEEVESIHRGAICVVNSAGAVEMALGSVHRSVFPRSAVKMIQALPLMESGAADHFALSDAEIALACSSHSGERGHVEAVQHWLARIDATADTLECGCHKPFSDFAAQELAAAHGSPTALHNNCSGKHAGFITTARHLGISAKNYTGPAHPVQKLVTAALSEMTECDLALAPVGVDGCGIPTYAMPLIAIARAMAKIAMPSTLHSRRSTACSRIFAAMTLHPWLVGGTDRFDTLAMQIGRGAFLVKMGAEGVHVAVHRGLGLGIALKVDDGCRRAADAAMAAVLTTLGILEATSTPIADEILNSKGEKVGAIRPNIGRSSAFSAFAR